MIEEKWDVFGEGPSTRVVQVGNGTMIYEEAKTYAADKIRSMSEPLLQRLAEIEIDLDKERNKIPPCKAWEYNCPHSELTQQLVVARTKKRAAELAGYTSSSFGRSYTLCEGHWWYHLAQEEGRWERERKNYRDEWSEWHKPRSEEDED